jgi:hypothetical protein
VVASREVEEQAPFLIPAMLDQGLLGSLRADGVRFVAAQPRERTQ